MSGPGTIAPSTPALDAAISSSLDAAANVAVNTPINTIAGWADNFFAAARADAGQFLSELPGAMADKLAVLKGKVSEFTPAALSERFKGNDGPVQKVEIAKGIEGPQIQKQIASDMPGSAPFGERTPDIKAALANHGFNVTQAPAASNHHVDMADLGQHAALTYGVQQRNTQAIGVA